MSSYTLVIQHVGVDTESNKPSQAFLWRGGGGGGHGTDKSKTPIPVITMPPELHPHVNHLASVGKGVCEEYTMLH